MAHCENEKPRPNKRKIVIPLCHRNSVSILDEKEPRVEDCDAKKDSSVEPVVIVRHDDSGMGTSKQNKENSMHIAINLTTKQVFVRSHMPLKEYVDSSTQTEPLTDEDDTWTDGRNC